MRKKVQSKASHKQKGAITLASAMIMLLVATYVALYSSNFGVSEQTILANNNNAQKAFETADAGMDFALPYLNKNRATIVVDSNEDGFIESYTDANTTNVTLTNGGTFSITYANPSASNFQLIHVTSTGTSPDGTATRTIHQDAQFRPILYRKYDIPVMAKGNVTMSSGYVSNPIAGSTTIRSGGNVQLWGAAHTVVNGVNSTTASPAPLNTDIIEDSSNLASASEDALFLNYFGATETFISSYADYNYTGYPDYVNVLRGKSNCFIWVNNNLSLGNWQAGYFTLGTITDPVILYVDGNLSLNNYGSIIGFIYVTGNINVSGNFTVTGSIVAGGTVGIYGAGNNVTYDATVMNNVQSKIGFFTKAPGTWNDLQ